jgi:hypothetical protein
MAVNMKFTVFWDVMPCSLVDEYQSFRGTSCPGNADSMFLWNITNEPTRLHDVTSQKTLIYDISHAQDIEIMANMKDKQNII